MLNITLSFRASKPDKPSAEVYVGMRG